MRVQRTSPLQHACSAAAAPAPPRPAPPSLAAARARVAHEHDGGRGRVPVAAAPALANVGALGLLTHLVVGGGVQGQAHAGRCTHMWGGEGRTGAAAAAAAAAAAGDRQGTLTHTLVLT